MADVTLGFKISEDLKEKAQELIESSGLKSKEWFEQVIQLVSMQGLKEGAPNFAKDIAELELHTFRINQLVANMVQRASFEKEEVERKIDEVKSSRDEIILGYQAELTELKEILKEAEAEVQAAVAVRDEAVKAEADIQSNLDDSRALAAEYREKNTALGLQLERYEEMVNQNNQLTVVNQQLQTTSAAQAAQIEQLQRDLATFTETNAQLTAQLEAQRQELQAQHQADLQRAQERHSEELDRLAEKKDVDKERAIFTLRTELQNKQQELIEAHSRKIESLYEQLRTVQSQQPQKKKPNRPAE